MTEYTKADLERIGRQWMARIDASRKREENWIKDATKAEAAYLCDSDSPGDVPQFNILHSNVETIVPSIYNSTPSPDIRPRHNNNDPLAKLVSDALERSVSTQIDDSVMDIEVEAAAQDTFMAGRGAVRVKFDADEVEIPTGEIDMETGEPVMQVGIANERVLYEDISWRDYAEGPAKRWGDVPWVAYRHEISEAERRKIEDKDLTDLYDDEAEQEEQDVPVWEIWCKDSRTVKFIIADSCKVIAIKEDPLKLSGFYPQPQPMQPITGTGRRTPVCPYTVYKTLAEELDTQTKRINKITQGLKVRGIIAADAGDLEALADLSDNELAPIGNIENLIAAGGLERAVMWWPIETAVAVLRELVAQREQTKTAIYEITGISDIIRGQGAASETATAQQIKTEWGSLRVKKMQRLVERHVRELMKLTAEIISLHFQPQAVQKASGMQIPPEAMQFLNKPLDHYRIDVETDSTVKADLGKNRREMSEFLQGTASFFQTMAPIVQSAPQAAGPLAQMYAAFARQFSLGKQAEDALEQFTQLAEQAAGQQRPDPGAEEAKLKAQEMGQKAQLDQAKMQLDREKMQMDAQNKSAEIGIKQQELALKGAEIELKREGKGAENIINTGNANPEELAQAFGVAVQAILAEIQQSHAATAQKQDDTSLLLAEAIRSGNEALAQVVSQGNQQVIAAMTAPKELVRDAQGRPSGVRTVQ